MEPPRKVLNARSLGLISAPQLTSSATLNMFISNRHTHTHTHTHIQAWYVARAGGHILIWTARTTCEAPQWCRCHRFSASCNTSRREWAAGRFSPLVFHERWTASRSMQDTESRLNVPLDRRAVLSHLYRRYNEKLQTLLRHQLPKKLWILSSNGRASVVETYGRDQTDSEASLGYLP